VRGRGGEGSRAVAEKVEGRRLGLQRLGDGEGGRRADLADLPSRRVWTEKKALLLFVCCLFHALEKVKYQCLIQMPFV
jgi:hypothetical protein